MSNFQVIDKPQTGPNASLMRSKKSVEMVREETQRDGKVVVIRAELPIGRGWNQGNGVIDWVNLGWKPADQYDAEKHQQAVKDKKSEKVEKAK